MSWLIAIGIVFGIIVLLVGIALLICRFELELIWCYAMLGILITTVIIGSIVVVHNMIVK